MSLIRFIGLVIYRSLIDSGLSFMKLPLSPGRAQGFCWAEVASVATCETSMSQPAFDILFRTGDGNSLWALALAFFPVQVVSCSFEYYNCIIDFQIS